MCLWIAKAPQCSDTHCLLFSYSGNVMKNHNKTRKTHHIWPLLNNLIKLAWYTNMKEQLLIREELLLPCLRIGNSSEALLTIRRLIFSKVYPLGHNQMLSYLFPTIFFSFQRSHRYLCLWCTQFCSQFFLYLCAIIHVFFSQIPFH